MKRISILMLGVCFVMWTLTTNSVMVEAACSHFHARSLEALSFPITQASLSIHLLGTL
jgi:hypothetical protein